MVIKPDSASLSTGPVTIRMPMPGALVRASARVTDVIPGPLPTVTLERFEHVEKCERRRYPRLYEPVAVRLKSVSRDLSDRTLAATNISGRGILLGWPGVPEVVLGERLQMTICLETGVCIPVAGEVVRIERYRSAVRFTDAAQEDLDALVGYVFRRDAERRKDRMEE